MSGCRCATCTLCHSTSWHSRARACVAAMELLPVSGSPLYLNLLPLAIAAPQVYVAVKELLPCLFFCNQCMNLPCARAAAPQVYVAVKELLPSAFRFDPRDRLTSTSEGGGVYMYCLQHTSSRRRQRSAATAPLRQRTALRQPAPAACCSPAPRLAPVTPPRLLRPSTGVLVGMAVMATSLVLFTL